MLKFVGESVSTRACMFVQTCARERVRVSEPTDQDMMDSRPSPQLISALRPPLNGLHEVSHCRHGILFLMDVVKMPVGKL